MIQLGERGSEGLVEEKHSSNLNQFVGNLKPLGPARATVKNSTRFLSLNIVEVTDVMLTRFQEDAHIALWGSRAVNNLCKSKRVRSSFKEKGVGALLDLLHEKHASDTEVLDWVLMAKETVSGGDHSTKSQPSTL